MIIKPIRTNIDHQAALTRISELTKGDPEILSDNEFDELEVLITLVDAYEAIHHKIEAPDPIEAIKFRMEQQGLRDEDLILIVGHRSKVSEVLNKKRRLSLTMIRKLHKQLNIPLETLVGEYQLNK